MPDQNELNKAINDKFVSKEKFAADIEAIVLSTSMNYIDAILFFCEKENIEVESVSKLMTKPLKEKLKVDATQLSFMKNKGGSKAKLPL